MTSGKTVSVATPRVIISPRIQFWLSAAFIVCIAVLARFINLGQQSLWNDELFSRYYPDLFDLKFLWTEGLLHENSPPLYYMAIEGWMRLFGSSEVAIRSLSVLASVLALPLVYLIATDLFDRRQGLIAALIFALSPMQISFAQEARTYALLLLPVGAVLLAITRLLRGDLRGRIFALYGIGAVVAIYCHATAAFFVTACNIVVILTILIDKSIGQRRAFIRWVVTNGIVALIAIPELIAMVFQGKTGQGIAWIPPFAPIDTVRSFSSLVAGVATPVKFLGGALTLLLFTALAAALFAIKSGQRAITVLIGIPAVFAGLIAIASLDHPIFIARVFCWMGIPLAILLAHAIASPSKVRPILLFLTIATGGIGLFYQYAFTEKEPWRDLFAQIGPDLARADTVILAPSTTPTAFAYYGPASLRLQMWDPGQTGSVENGYLPERMGAQVVERDQVIRAITSGERVWLVLRTPDLPLVNQLLKEVPKPRFVIERDCGKVTCLAAMAW